MFSTTILTSLAICFVAVAGSVITTPGKCPNVTVEQNFSFQKFLGRWYCHGGSCITHEYTDNKNGTLGFTETTKQGTTVGTLSRATEVGDGKLLLIFPDILDFPREYYILATDYDQFAVGWSCVVDGSKNYQSSEIFTRERNPSAAVLASANAVIDRSGIAKD
ncbi:lazarillo protein-like isoform X2 [Neocloeon triangulifer]|uniref:lazarillo protein-like isoform X1 n=1 Tax=Neocloeon triangulifer TaxID=2078957 RepID=UPI00286EFE50|nr:lazarillo protein-like isoform X1 [Neocloeon triangulifer]XP_059485442.1 lazarillo protein-like isoform X2 [Neocloeon triangulifer]